MSELLKSQTCMIFYLCNFNTLVLAAMWLPGDSYERESGLLCETDHYLCDIYIWAQGYSFFSQDIFDGIP